MQATTYL